MIRIFSHYVSGRLALLFGLEAVVLLVSAYAGIAFQYSAFGAALQGSERLVTTAAFPLGMLVLITSLGLYQLDPWEDLKTVQSRLVTAGLIMCFAGFVVWLAVPAFYMGPSAIVIAVMTAITGSALVRFGFYKWGDLDSFKSRVLVLGTGSRVLRFAEYARRNHNHTVVGYVGAQASKHYVPLPNVIAVEPGDSLASVVDKHGIDQIVIAVRDRRGGGLPVQDLLRCRLKGVKISELPSFFEREYRQVLLESINPSWMVFGEGFRTGGFRAIAKRLFDIVASSMLLIAALPVLVLAAVCIVIENGFPIVYRQERVGQGGRTFTIFKLRSMRNDAEKDGKPRWAAANDDRTTRVGRIIRKLRIDELPQIFNILKGEMSFVGPRPERPYFVDKLAEQIPYYALRHSVKPGLTGWAQVCYPYGASLDDTVEKLQYDLYYVKNHGLFLDLMIMIATVEVVLWGKGAR